MGLDITYEVEKEKISFRLSNNDIEVCDFLRKKCFEKEIDIIFNVSDFGECRPVNQEDLLRSVNKLLAKFKDEPGLLPYTYVIKQEVPLGSGNYSSGTGSTSGFKVNGEQFSIESGLDHCVIYKLKQNESGDCTYDFNNPIDVRNRDKIKIDDECREVSGIVFGDIIIDKKRKPTKLVKNLEKLKSFLSKVDVKVIQKTLG